MANMRSSTRSSSDLLTVLVFKENRPARTFQIPLGWISRFGVFLGGLAGIALFSIALSLKYYGLLRKSDPSRIRALEDQLKSFQQAKAQPVPANPTPPANPLAPTTAGPAGLPLIFSALPQESRPVADPSAIPIRIENLKLSWQGQRLKIHFDLQYFSNDGGTQNGRIVVLARGMETLLAYPEGVLNEIGQPALISPERGEYFAVSRFRETNAEFPAVRSRASLKGVEILIFNPNGQLLIDQKDSPSLVPRGAAESPRKSQGASAPPQQADPDSQDPSKSSDDSESAEDTDGNNAGGAQQ